MAKALYKEGQRISGFAFEDAAQPRAERRDGLRGRPKMGTQGWGPGLGEAPRGGFSLPRDAVPCSTCPLCVIRIPQPSA